jgi:O-antigen ligase
MSGARIVALQKTAAIAYQPRWFQNRRLLFGTIAAVLLSWLMTVRFGLSWPLSVVLAVQLVLFILLFHRPIWAMASMLVGQFTTAGYRIPLTDTVVISIHFLWTILALLLLVPVLRNRGSFNLGRGAKRIIIPAIIFFSIATISNLVNTNLSVAAQYLRNFTTALVIVVLLPATIKNEKDIKRLSLVALITCAVSAIVAVMQHYSFRGLPIIELYPGSYWPGRTSGLAGSPVNLAFTLPIVILPAIAIYFARGVTTWSRQMLAVLILVMAAALYFTYTRSGMYALAPGLLLILFLIKGKAKKELLLVTLVLVVAFLYYIDMRGNRYSQGFAEEESAAGRLVLWQAGARIALDYPLLGIGEGRFQEISVSYSEAVNPDVMNIQDAAGVLSNNPVHNDFLRVWLAFGTLALIAYLWFFVNIFRNFLDAYRRSRTRFLKGFGVGILGATAGYIVNAATHNFMDTQAILWVLGGLSIAAVKLALSKPPLKAKELR